MYNSLKTVILLGTLTAILIFIGGIFGGEGGMIIALVVASIMNIGSYWYSDKLVLKMYRAQPIEERQAPELFAIVRELARRGGMPMPKIAVLPQQEPNAFATGRNPENAVVAVTEGLYRLMDRDQLTGVLAHEMAHIKNRDILVGSVAATLAGAVMVLANMAQWAAFLGIGGDSDEEDGGSGLVGLLLTAVLAPIAATLVQMAVSRSREYKADQTGAELAGSPLGLAEALTRLEAAAQRTPMEEAKPATAHMFIINPLSGKDLAGMFSTHPPTAKRVERLTAMAGLH